MTSSSVAAGSPPGSGLVVNTSAGETVPPIDSSLVVLPSIFDAYAQPDLLLPLVLANLLSPQLWSLSARVRERAASDQAGAGGTAHGTGAAPRVAGSSVPGRDHATDVEGATRGTAQDALPPTLRAAQVQIDRSFEHLTPTRTAELFGELDLDEEAARVGSGIVDHALREIMSGIRRRVADGTLDPAIETALLDLIAHRRFPAYHYATFDIVRANRRLVQGRRRVPHGLTSCLDEAAIFAALVLTLPEIAVNSVVCLGSPEHYTAFGWNESGEPWWFYSKNKLLSEAEWQRIVDADHAGDAQAAFDRHLNQIDRVVSISGTYHFALGQSSIPEDHLRQIVAMLDRFFGVRLRQVDLSLRQPIAYRPPSPFAPVFRELLADRSEPKTRRKLRKQVDPEIDRLMEIVLHAYRSLTVADLTPYLVAARRSPMCRELAATLTSITAALDLVRAIPGRESIFGDRERIAMPEETLRFQTGSDRDFALLVHVLLESMPGAAHAEITTVFAPDDSYVVGPGYCVSLRQMALVETSEADVPNARRLAAPMPQPSNRA